MSLAGTLKSDDFMTSQEINEAVARKLGWKPIKEISEEKRIQNHFEGYLTHWTQDEGKSSSWCLPAYSQSIHAAWEIVKLIKTPIRMIEIETPMGEAHWVCRIYENGDIIAGHGADTAPMAICKAFLKLEESK